MKSPIFSSSVAESLLSLCAVCVCVVLQNSFISRQRGHSRARFLTEYHAVAILSLLYRQWGSHCALPWCMWQHAHDFSRHTRLFFRYRLHRPTHSRRATYCPLPCVYVFFHCTFFDSIHITVIPYYVTPTAPTADARARSAKEPWGQPRIE